MSLLCNHNCMSYSLKSLWQLYAARDGDEVEQRAGSCFHCQSLGLLYNILDSGFSWLACTKGRQSRKSDWRDSQEQLLRALVAASLVFVSHLDEIHVVQSSSQGYILVCRFCSNLHILSSPFWPLRKHFALYSKPLKNTWPEFSKQAHWLHRNMLTAFELSQWCSQSCNA